MGQSTSELCLNVSGNIHKALGTRAAGGCSVSQPWWGEKNAETNASPLLY